MTPRRTFGVAVLAGALAVATPAAPAHARPLTLNVACRPQALINAVRELNRAGAGTIRLAHHCVYRFGRRQAGDDALPPITADLTLRGNGAVLERAARAPRLRIVHVTGNGVLTATDVTLARGEVAGSGGDLLVDGAATLHLADSRITGGSAVQGGGIYLDSTSAGHSIVGSTVEHNTGRRRVGAAGLGLAKGSVLIDHSSVTGNTGVGISVSRPASAASAASAARITHCLILGNTRNGILSAGDLTVDDTRISRNRLGGLSTSGTANVHNSQITNNTSVRGAGILNYAGGNLTVEGTSVLDNVATGSSAVGGGIDNDVLGGSAPTVVVRNSPISGNSAYSGGGVTNLGGTATLDHSPVTGNTAVFGGGISNLYGALTLQTTPVTRNTARRDGGGVYNLSATVTGDTGAITDNRPNDCGGPAPVPGCS